jgi:hypothetical protein
MNRVYVVTALFFMFVIAVSLWSGLGDLQQARNATADGATAGLAK